MNDKIDLNITEDEDVARAKAWWAENGKAIIGGVALGTALVIGYNYWQSNQISTAEAASNRYSKVLETAQEGEVDGEAVSALVSDYGNSTYAVLALFQQAKNQAEANDMAGAVDTLKSAATLKGADGALGTIVKLRLASAQMGAEQFDAALATLNELDAQSEGFVSARVIELRGDVYQGKGDAQAAKTAYQTALDMDDLAVDARERLTLKQGAL